MVRFAKFAKKRKRFSLIENGESGVVPMSAMVEKRSRNGINNHAGSHTTTDFQREMLKQEKRSLPIYHGRRRIIEEIRKSDSVIVMSETGSGKTTQVPQYLLEEGFAKDGLIACTQPRRVAAITIAQRVAEEKNSNVGNLVGYCVRFEDCTSERTKIKYMTDGMLLRESLSDPLLRHYSVIILDEAHERTIHTDVLFGVVKSAQKERKKKGLKVLKIVIMSATLQAEKFSIYFNGAKILYAEGRQHPIKIMFTEEPQSDYLHAALVSAINIHKEMPPEGDILVFLTGQEEIESLGRLLNDCGKTIQDGVLPQISVHPLFAALPPAVQLQAVSPARPGCRKIILATNIAETSITIRGVKYVVDTGMVKTKNYNPQTGLDILTVQPVSKAQARQRCGRAGRECPGVCYRLYTEESFRKLRSQSVPEILRCNMPGVVLQLLALGVSNVSEFDFMDKPSSDALENAVDQLQFLKAIVVENKEYKLTSIGQCLVAFPLDPRFSKVILAAKEHGCSEEVLSIISMLSVDSITYTPSERKEDLKEVNAKFSSSEGDHITLLNIYRAYKQNIRNSEWCSEHFINERSMRTVIKVRKQLQEVCVRQGIGMISCGRDYAKVRKAFANGLFMNSAELQRDGTFLTTNHKEPVAIHPNSALFRAKPAFVIYGDLVKTSKCYMRGLSIVDPEWLIDACPDYFERNRIRLCESSRS